MINYDQLRNNQTYLVGEKSKIEAADGNLHVVMADSDESGKISFLFFGDAVRYDPRDFFILDEVFITIDGETFLGAKDDQ